VRQFVAYAAPWEPIPDDGLPRFPTAGTARAQATEPVSRESSTTSRSPQKG
jgi:hypothetical protein